MALFTDVHGSLLTMSDAVAETHEGGVEAHGPTTDVIFEVREG